MVGDRGIVLIEKSDIALINEYSMISVGNTDVLKLMRKDEHECFIVVANSKVVSTYTQVWDTWVGI